MREVKNRKGETIRWADCGWGDLPQHVQAAILARKMDGWHPSNLPPTEAAARKAAYELSPDRSRLAGILV